MKKTIRILHIDPDYRVSYFIRHEGVLISSPITQEQAISLLKSEDLDLVLSEPHHKAILNPRGNAKQLDLNFDAKLSTERKMEDFFYEPSKK
jgi:hypothetical protein